MPGERNQGRVAYLVSEGTYWQLWTMNPDGSEARALTRSSREKAKVSWFPDGRQLLVNTLDGDFVRVDGATGEEARVARISGTTDAVVSPDGSKIAFSRSIANSVDDNEIWVMNSDGSGARKLTDMPGLQDQPAWHPDGSWIFFLSGDGRQYHDIWRVNRGTGSREQLSAGAAYHYDLALSKGGRLAFANNRSGNYEIYVQDGLELPTRVTDDPALDGSPTWSPDGTRLIFHSARGGSLNLWTVAAEGGEATQLTDHAGGARAPVWSHP